MEEIRPVTPWYRSPFWLAVIGLALMFGGYQASVFVPSPTPQEQRQANKLAELHGMAEDEALRGRLADVAKNAQAPPPFRWPGRLLMLAGAMLTVSAGVIVLRQPSRPPQEPVDPEPDDFAGEEEMKVDRPA